MVSCWTPMELVESSGDGSLDNTPTDLVNLIC
jgi:hypothetical protein